MGPQGVIAPPMGVPMQPPGYLHGPPPMQQHMQFAGSAVHPQTHFFPQSPAPMSHYSPQPQMQMAPMNGFNHPTRLVPINGMNHPTAVHAAPVPPQQQMQAGGGGGKSKSSPISSGGKVASDCNVCCKGDPCHCGKCCGDCCTCDGCCPKCCCCDGEDICC